MLHKNILYALLLLLPFLSKAQLIPPPASNLPNNIVAEPVPFDKLITAEAKSIPGMINIYTLKDRYYFEIKDSILERPVMMINRIVKSSAAIDKIKEGYGGEELGDNTIIFKKGHGKKIYLTEYRGNDRSIDSTKNGLKRQLDQNNTPAILLSFDVKAYGAENKSAIIDVTDFISGNSRLISGFSFSEKPFQADKSYVAKIQSFPLNTEIQAYKTYGVGTKDSTMSVILNTSFLLLPKQVMRERNFDPRVGYFTPFNFDYDKNSAFASMQLKISRWRMEPKPEDIEKYKRGELVEPIKPIIFYIDPATPKQWVPFLIAGVNDWQVAFEQAGFKNAIKAVEVPENDTTWDMNDARYSVIVYKPSLMANAAGPSTFDKRSGEILASHVSWYHNVMTLLHDWYLMQAGAIDEKAQHQEFSTELMGQLIRFVSSHEIGHTLGLSHNFGSSSTVPVEKLRDKKWVEENGHTPSIMDYARFNYVAQPEDNISEAGIFPRIGDYDKWAIEYGYRLYPEIENREEEEKLLFNKITATLKSNPRLYFGAQELFLGLTDPRRQSEDLSDNVMVANTYGIKNLKRILDNLPKWSEMPTDQFGDRSGNGLRRNYSAFLNQLSIYHMHVVNTIGKGYSTYVSVNDTTKVFSLVPKSKQHEAVLYLNKQVFSPEAEWIEPTAIMDQVWIPINGQLKKFVADEMLNNVLAIQKLMNLEKAALVYGEKTYSVEDLFTDLDKGVWNELSSGTIVSNFHIGLQQQYVSILLKNLSQPSVATITLSGVIREHMFSLKNRIKAILPKIKDQATRYHYNDILLQIASIEEENIN
ncbi:MULTISPECIES: zinc-dependent metalloprotease [Flavobacterium]|uniref:zinc-dependent metalloprotease n=1 Tax=Flavobacterium TaxID=237 RepID=UPI002113D66C|nr:MULTISPECIES: zinc-dependent metalloprotease [Flavobacterium]UUF12449.1 zinc-dependent metalloprotease [Flavobacterium panici]